MIRDVEFAVVDVETTGLFPRGNDRIIEIAALRVDTQGSVLDEYQTLVNPRRDMGPIHIHGIASAHVKDAPQFEEIAGDVLRVLSGAIFASHNVRFDLEFVRSEMDRIGCQLPDFPSLCTMRLARKADPCLASRNLGAVCAHFGIEHTEAHSAYGDAFVAAQLLAACIDRIGVDGRISLETIGVEGQIVAGDCWPRLPVSGKSRRREEVTRAEDDEPSYLSQLVARLPATGLGAPHLDEYLALLDRALEDRRVTAEEASALLDLANDVGLGRERAIEAHHQYMSDLIDVALQDDVISESEMEDLQSVRHVLSIEVQKLETLVEERKDCKRRIGNSAACTSINRPQLAGASICFTGELQCRVAGELATRSVAETKAADAGMIIKKTVTKKLDYLVTPDPDSMSGKAKKARAYGVRILAEPVFWQLVGVQVD